MTEQETRVWAAVYAAIIGMAQDHNGSWDELRRRARVEAAEAVSEYRREAAK